VVAMRQSASDRVRTREVFIGPPGGLGVYGDYSACFGICNCINANHENGVRHFFCTVTFLKGGSPNRPTTFLANFFNYFLNLFLPRAARPTKPVPIRIIVADSGTDDIPKLSAKAASGRSNKTHKINAAILSYPFKFRKCTTAYAFFHENFKLPMSLSTTVLAVWFLISRRSINWPPVFRRSSHTKKSLKIVIELQFSASPSHVAW
jgi:hypothetical protein